MPPIARTLIILFFQAIVCAGALAITRTLPDPAALKTPIMLLGILGLLPALAWRMKAGIHLLPGLLLFAYLYVRVTPGPGQHAATLSLLAAASAFLLGISRVPLAGVKLLVPVLILTFVRGMVDLFTLTHLGGDAPAGHAVTSFFADKHVAAGVLVLGAFLHFHLMERGGPQRPVQVLLYTSALVVMLGIVLSDSRAAQGAFVLCFLPLLFLTLRLDGKEPAPERLAWIAGITLCLGLAWINLPDAQLRRVAEALSPSHPGRVQWAWTTALNVFEQSPLAGAGLGGFRYAAVEHMGSWMQPGAVDALPVLTHAHNHLFQVLAEGGAAAASLEAYLLLIALVGMAVIYFRENRLQAKYGFLCLATLAIMGLFTPVLDKAPLDLAYWGLIGYGWSFAVEGIPRWLLPYRSRVARPRRRDRAVGILTACVLAGLSLWHLTQRGRELRSIRVYTVAQSLAGVNPKASTDLLAESLEWDARNVEANYSYARVLAFFRREEDAVKRVAYIQSFAPDSLREAEVLSEIYGILGSHGRAADQARRILARYPDYLAANEILAESLRNGHDCEDLETFRIGAARLEAVYPMPPSREYIIASLDSLFRSNRDINFLQRWFAGTALRKRFVELNMLAYNRGAQHHGRVRTLRQARCRPAGHDLPGGGGPSGPMPSPARLDGESEPPRWDAPRNRLQPDEPRPRRKRRGRVYAERDFPPEALEPEPPARFGTARRFPGMG